MSYTSELITNRNRAKQILAFDGMKFGLCRPTDIDLSMDFGKQSFVFGELKGTGAPLTVGQRIHLEGLVDAITAGGRQATAFVAHHDTLDCESDVLVKDATVTSYYNMGKWNKCDVRVNDFINAVYDTYLESKKAGSK